MKSKSRTTDLTEGSLARHLLVFSFPILVGLIFQNLYQSVDTVVVGRYVGTTALAAVSSSMDISNLLVGFFTGFSTGASVLFARHFGSKDKEKLQEAIHTAVAFSLIIGIVMAAIGVLLTPQLLRMVDCPDNVLPEAEDYLRVYLIGVLFTSIYNVGSGVLRAAGDSRSPFYYLFAACILNIILDLTFVKALSMGVRGTAIATIISQFVSVSLVARRLLTTTDIYRLELRKLRINGTVLLSVIKLGIPAAIQSCLISFSNLFVQRYVNQFGSDLMAGVGAGKRVDFFGSLYNMAIGQALPTVISQNLGAGKRDRAYRAIPVAIGLGMIFTVVLSALLLLFPDWFISLFTDDPNAAVYGVRLIMVMTPFYLVHVFLQVYMNAIRGFGKSLETMVISVIGMVGIRQAFLAISMAINHSENNVYYAFPVGWVGAAVLCVAYFHFFIRRKEKRRSPGETETL